MLPSTDYVRRPERPVAAMDHPRLRRQDSHGFTPEQVGSGGLAVAGWLGPHTLATPPRYPVALGQREGGPSMEGVQSVVRGCHHPRWHSLVWEVLGPREPVCWGTGSLSLSSLSCILLGN